MGALQDYFDFVMQYAPYFYYISGTGVDPEWGRGPAAAAHAIDFLYECYYDSRFASSKTDIYDKIVELADFLLSQQYRTFSFGYETKGSIYTLCPDIFICKYQCPKDMKAISISVYVTTGVLDRHIKCAIYDSNLDFIASSADKNGAIGYDFRVEPDAKFAFFPRNSKTSPVSLSDLIETSEYHKDIHRIRNKIYVFGAAEKANPSDKDAWTETLDINGDETNDWQSGTGTGSVSLDSTEKAVGSYSIKHTTNTSDYYGRLTLVIPSGWQPNFETYPSLQFQIRRQAAFSAEANVILQDNTGKWAIKRFQLQADEWYLQKFNVGKKYENEWEDVDAGFNWEIINQIMWDVYFTGTGTGSFWVDDLFFNHKRWDSMQENSGSQSSYGLRELVETDEELHSDNECLLRAKASLAHLKDPAEYITVRSTVIDYGTTPLLPGDKIHVTLPNENIDADYRIISVEYHQIAATQTLEITLELGKEPPLLADYLFKLRGWSDSLSRYKRGLR